jgi:hypothetical protein
MKQSDKAPFFEKEDGVFVLGGMTKGDKTDSFY